MFPSYFYSLQCFGKMHETSSSNHAVCEQLHDDLNYRLYDVGVPVRKYY